MPDRTSPEGMRSAAEELTHYREAVSAPDAEGPRPHRCAHPEMQWTLAERPTAIGTPAVDAARMAVNRAVKRLAAELRRACRK